MERTNTVPAPVRGSTWRDGHPADTARVALYVGLVYASLAIADGHRNFLVNGIGLTLCLLLSLLRVPRFYRLHMVWTAAYLYVIVNEGLFGAEAIVHRVSRDHYNVAASYLNAANALVLLGNALVFRERRDNQALARPVAWPSWVRTLVAPQLYLVGWSIVYVWLAYPRALDLLNAGRVGANRDLSSAASDTIMRGLLSGAALALPALNTYYLLYVLRAPPLWAAAACLPFFAIQFAMGTRFVLLMALLGAVLVYLAKFPLTRRVLPRVLGLAPLGLALFVAGQLMKEIRVFGISEVRFTSITDVFTQAPDGGYEGCVAMMSQLVDYFRSHDLLYGASSGNLFIFWIPREFWPDKPTMLGYWFPRAYGESGYSSSHSVSSGFPADFYVDFGFWGGLAVTAVLGLVAGLVEQKVARMLDRRGPSMALAATMYGASFFAVRSPQTTVIVMTGVIVLTVGFAMTLPKVAQIEAARRPRVPPAPPRLVEGGTEEAGPARRRVGRR